MNEIKKEIYERWKKFFPTITLEQAQECETIAIKQLNGLIESGNTIEKYIIDNIDKDWSP